MIRPGTQEEILRRRVNLPTAKSHAALKEVEPKLRAHAFFSARVADARILEKLRAVSDSYSRGEIGLGEARNRLKDFLRGEGYDPHQSGLRNLASTARLNLILRQNASMAHAAAEWKRMHDPDAMAVFPYVRYHARHDRRTRGAHSDLDGRIFRKDDPFLSTHTPPWEFNCRCYLEEITEKEAQADAGRIQEPTPEDKVRVDSESGFSFNPAHAFEEFDLSNLQPVSRATIIRQAAEAVREEKIGSVGLIAAPPTSGEKPVPIPGIPAVRSGFEAMRTAARKALEDVGLDPDKLPDYRQVNEAFAKAGEQGKDIPGDVLRKFPEEPFEVAKLNSRAAEAAGMPELPIMLDRGGDYRGIKHLWRNHKELFVDPDSAVRMLRETVGDPNCRVVVSLKPVKIKEISRGKIENKAACLKRLVLHNPKTRTYCILVEHDNALHLVSWHNAEAEYGNSEWMLE